MFVLTFKQVQTAIAVSMPLNPLTHHTSLPGTNIHKLETTTISNHMSINHSLQNKQSGSVYNTVIYSYNQQKNRQCLLILSEGILRRKCYTAILMPELLI
jgi:hypothetical protein